jgi:hypothetical protein
MCSQRLLKLNFFFSPVIVLLYYRSNRFFLSFDTFSPSFGHHVHFRGFFWVSRFFRSFPSHNSTIL